MERSHRYHVLYTFPRGELNQTIDSLREGGFKIDSVGADYGVYEGEKRVSLIKYQDSINAKRNDTMQMDVEITSSLDKFLLKHLKN